MAPVDLDGDMSENTISHCSRSVSSRTPAATAWAFMTGMMKTTFSDSYTHSEIVSCIHGNSVHHRSRTRVAQLNLNLLRYLWFWWWDTDACDVLWWGLQVWLVDSAPVNVASKWCDCKINILMSLKLFGDEAWRKCDMVLGWCLSPSFLTSWPCLSLPWCADCYAALNLPLALYPDPSCIRGDQLSAQSIPLFLLTDRIALRTQTWRLDEGQRSAHRLRQRWIQMKTDG